MRTKITIAFAAASALALAACGSGGGDSGGTRDSIRAVGSSTVYPFAKAVAEDFSRANPQFKSPLIESTGTGGGMKLFCSGLGSETPDVTNASRRMKPAEFAECQANGVTDVIEVQIGLDGLAFASAQGGIKMNLTPKIVYEAIAARPYGKEQTAKTWRDVDASLPAEPILVYGPPSTSGTRDSLKELILEVGCQTDPAMKALKDSDEDRYDQVCTEVRSDGTYVDQGEQDNLIVQKIKNNPKAVGVFGYSYLEENSRELQGLPMNGVEPSYEAITAGDYPGAREMFIYAKKAHLGVIPGLSEFLAAWIQAMAPDGALAKIGMVASPAAVRTEMAARIESGTTLKAGDLD